MAAIRLQNIVASSSRPRVRATCTRQATSTTCLTRAILRMSPASVTRASAAKCDTFAGGTPTTQAAVGPSASSQVRWVRCTLNRDSDAAPAGRFRSSNRLRLVTGSVRSSSASRSRPVSPIRS